MERKAEMTVRVHCVVNNEVAASSHLWGEHGLCFFIENGEHCLLFDSGQTSAVLQHNLQALGIDVRRAAAIALSHGHNDHTGGLPYLLACMDHPRVIGSPNIFEEKFSSRGAKMHTIGISLSRKHMQTQADWTPQEELLEILPGVFITGSVPRRTDFEHGDAHLIVKHDGQMVPDPIPDDRSLVLQTEKGLVVLLGCCHAGLINTLSYIRDQFAQPVRAVLGGSHLKPAGAQQLERTIQVLQHEFDSVEVCALNHCTGFDALASLRQAWGKRVQPFLAGNVLDF
jgi:7,8-dihydropterin-6-yl-methyl-4-(beta-D-ribofuranosyl)aminobenzene 5'-phosphate synthase